MASSTETRTRPLAGALSVAIHVLVVVGLLRITAPWVAPARLPGLATGHHIVLVYSPRPASPDQKDADEAARQRLKKDKHHLLSKQRTPKLLPAQVPVPQAAPMPPALKQIPGEDALGSGDVSIALMSFFPAPKPDLAKLPHGVAGDVILDVVIDAAGKITQLTKTQGLGYGVDESVIATVQTWTFQPATRNGQPVASEQELHFHYERG